MLLPPPLLMLLLLMLPPLLPLLMKLCVAPGAGGSQWHPVPVVLCQRLRMPQAQAAGPEGQAHSEANQEAHPQTSA